MGLPPEPFAGSNLIRIISLTSEVVVRICAAEVEVVEGATQGEGSAMGSEEATIRRSGYDLDFSVSRVT